MEITRNTFEKLSVLDKYIVEFQKSSYESNPEYRTVEYVYVKTSNLNGVYHCFKISTYNDSSDYVQFVERFSEKNGKTSKGWTFGYNFKKRIERDLKKSNLI